MSILDYDGLRHLVAIMDARYARARYGQDDWHTVQKYVRLGQGEAMYPVGSQFTIEHSTYGNILMDVVSHDTVKKYSDESAHTMTLMAHNCVANLQSDGAEAMYYAATGLSAGTYNFTVPYTQSLWAKGTYQFTLSKDAPVGAQLKIGGANDWAWKAAITDLPMNVYASSGTSDVYEAATITSGSEGTSLGTMGTELNELSRISYGSNNYKESAIRQWLNSAEEAGAVWKAQTYFDRPPTWSDAGFMNGFNQNFLDAVAIANIKCAGNNYYECPESMGGTVNVGSQYAVADKFFLPSMTEVGLTGDFVVDGSVLMKYFEGATAASRIKDYNSAAARWGTRTENGGDGFVVWNVATSGGSTQLAGADATGIVPCCIIA